MNPLALTSIILSVPKRGTKKDSNGFVTILLILLLLVLVGTILDVGNGLPTGEYYEQNAITSNEVGVRATPSLPAISSMSTETPSPVPQPTPDDIPTLRPYQINKEHDIWHAQDPSSYIIPSNEWVRYFALEQQKYRAGEYSNYPQIDYIPDNIAYPLNIDKDIWQNPDYTLYIGQGDCEDISIAWVSMHRSLGHKAMVVAGEIWFNDGSPNIQDFWYEWIDEDGIKSTKYVASNLYEKTFTAKPKYMFNDKISWREYNENWYK